MVITISHRWIRQRSKRKDRNYKCSSMISLIFRDAVGTTTFVRHDTNIFQGNESIADRLADTGQTFTVLDIKDRDDNEIVAGFDFERNTYSLADFITKAGEIAGVGLYAVNGNEEYEIVAP